MGVFERPARHLPARALQWQVGDKKPPLGLAGAKYGGFTLWKPWESLSGSPKPHIFDYLP
jgi:hypothetical protein